MRMSIVLAFFLTGAYQEIRYETQLFTTNEAVVTFDENGNYKLENLIEAQNLMDVLGVWIII